MLPGRDKPWISTTRYFLREFCHAGWYNNLQSGIFKYLQHRISATGYDTGVSSRWLIQHSTMRDFRDTGSISYLQHGMSATRSLLQQSTIREFRHAGLYNLYNARFSWYWQSYNYLQHGISTLLSSTTIYNTGCSWNTIISAVYNKPNTGFLQRLLQQYAPGDFCNRTIYKTGFLQCYLLQQSKTLVINNIVLSNNLQHCFYNILQYYFLQQSATMNIYNTVFYNNLQHWLLQHFFLQQSTRA